MLIIFGCLIEEAVRKMESNEEAMRRVSVYMLVFGSCDSQPKSIATKRVRDFI